VISVSFLRQPQRNKNYASVVVVIAEQSSGNDCVGDMWLETKIFNKEATIGEVVDWAFKRKVSGRLILTIPDNDPDLL
jgi:hypothetical protein